jgi:hypothetical protein
MSDTSQSKSALAPWLAVSALVLSLAACGRLDYDSPAIQGRVTDRATGNPVDSAFVALKEYPEVNARVDANGTFTLPALRKTSITIPWADAIYLGCCKRGIIVVQASDYKTLEYLVRPRDPDRIEILLQLERN